MDVRVGRLPRLREPKRILREDRLDAETTHLLQPKDLRLPRGIPGPDRLQRFKEESGLPWAELNRRLGIHPQTMRRWRDKGGRPSTPHMMALLSLPDSLRLGPSVDRMKRRGGVAARKPQGRKRKKGAYMDEQGEPSPSRRLPLSTALSVPSRFGLGRQASAPRTASASRVAAGRPPPR